MNRAEPILLIERAVPEDVDALMMLWRRSVDATHLHFISSKELDSLTPAVRDYLQTGQTEFWVLRDTKKLAGFMGLNSGKLESLFVAPEYFRKGFGRKLVNHAIRLSEVLLVDVNEENASAIAFYESCGFVRTGRSELDAQGNHHPLIHMKREPGDSSGTLPERRSSHQAPEIRTDILTGRQCIVAPDRASRPAAFTPDPPLIRIGANGDLQDPFAEGNEHETPGERFALRSAGSTPNMPGWTLRVVPNRYPAVVPEEEFQSKSNGPSTNDFQFFPVQHAIGEHDVVIECADSRSHWSELSHEEATAVFSAWRTRIRQLVAGGQFQSLSVFRNEGFSAGASLSHCHSQIVAHRELTPLDRIRHQRQLDYRATTSHQVPVDDRAKPPADLAGALLEAEVRDNVRIVSTSQHFVAHCPFASRSAYHVRIVPRDGIPWTYADVADEAISELAALTKMIVQRWTDALGSCPSFNMLLPHSRLDRPAQFRWMLELIPRTGRIAGLELLSDLDVVTVSPENAAKSLATV
ncbi:MAG: GNAT family N-acetyltransferase [Planctomycetaceae bacterium]|nr:GNAT family N-acetyltransferase [Planctomycetaceae bacterium]